MKVECDAHNFMFAFVFVANNPYYAAVKKNGSFLIDNVPPGNYTIRTWHGTLKSQKADITVKSRETLTVNFQLSIPD